MAIKPKPYTGPTIRIWPRMSDEQQRVLDENAEISRQRQLEPKTRALTGRDVFKNIYSDRAPKR